LINWGSSIAWLQLVVTLSLLPVCIEQLAADALAGTDSGMEWSEYADLTH
jgi:hypothetical protein